jgi:hypothetical protein
MNDNKKEHENPPIIEDKKYILTDETKVLYGRKLYRIKALKDFGNIKKGDIGGWVEKEENLSHYDNCWVYNEAKVYDNAFVYDEAKVYGNAFVYGNAKVYGDAEVRGYARVYGNARVYDNAKVYGNTTTVFGYAQVYGEARVHGDASDVGVHVFGYAIVTIPPTLISGLEYRVIITDNLIFCGCKAYTKEEWLSFTDEEILEMDGKKALMFYNEKLKVILQLVD